MGIYSIRLYSTIHNDNPVLLEYADDLSSFSIFKRYSENVVEIINFLAKKP